MASQQAVVEDEAFVTLATNDTYAVGALVLAHSLRNVGTTRRLAIMITMGVTQGVRQQLSEVFDVVTVVNVLDSRDNVNLALLTRPDLGVTFTKLHCWRLTQFSKCVFLDADTLVLHNVDELFEREELSAAPDAGWPDCFNSGVFVFRPSEETYQSLLQFAVSQGSFDGGDQGLLNMYFHDWATKDINKHLPFIYNVVSQAFYSYLPAFRYYGKTVKIVHFIGAIKPWHHSFNLNTGEVEPLPDAGHNKDYLQQWWTIFMQKVQPGLAPSLFGSGTQNELFSFTWTSFGPHSHHHDHLPPETFSPPTVISYYRPSETSESFDIHVVENKDHRYFAPLEAHYTEPPMSHAEEYPASLIAYEAKDFYQKINEFSATTHREAETENNTDSEIVVSLPYNTDTVSDGGSEEIEGPSELIHVQVVEPVVEQKTQVEKEKLPSFWNRERTEANSECTNDVNQEMGLVGQLASLRIERGSGYTQEQLDDRNRQVEWERGQIDYLGIDSFSNIQKRLDTMIDPKQQPAAAPAAAKQPAAAPATAKQPAAKQPTSKAPTGRGATKPAPGKKS